MEYSARLLSCCFTDLLRQRSYRGRFLIPRAFACFHCTLRSFTSTVVMTNVSGKEGQSDPQTTYKTKRKRKGEIILNLPETKKEEILGKLNSCSLEELSNTKGIGKSKAAALVEHRDSFGMFKNIEELIHIKGFGKAFFQRLEETGELTAVEKKRSKGLEKIQELLAHHKIEMIPDIVSIDIGFQNAAWVHMDKNKQVLGWSRAEILKPKPYNPAVFRPLVQSFVNSVPKTDIYVVEMQSHRIGKQTAALLPFAVHLRVFEAMLNCLLPGVVIPFDPQYTSKHFCLPTGNSKKRAAVNLVESLFLDRRNEEPPFEVQCEQFLKEQQGMGGSEDLVESLIDNPPSRFAGNNNNPLLQISPKFINYFKSADKKDDLSDCLLQALAFFDLVVERKKQ